MTGATDLEPAALEAAVKTFQERTGGFDPIDDSLEIEAIIRAYLAARSAPEAGKAVDETLFDIEPYLADEGFGPEWSLRFIMKWFYRENGLPEAKAKDVTERYIAALASSPAPTGAEPVAWRPTHRHKKRGSTYRVIAQGRLQVDADLDNEKVVVYRGEDGQVWVRPTYEFNDGRFETLPAAPLPEDTHHG